jgi:hypothetical protein
MGPARLAGPHRGENLSNRKVLLVYAAVDYINSNVSLLLQAVSDELGDG